MVVGVVVAVGVLLLVLAIGAIFALLLLIIPLLKNSADDDLFVGTVFLNSSGLVVLRNSTKACVPVTRFLGISLL